MIHIHLAAELGDQSIFRCATIATVLYRGGVISNVPISQIGDKVLRDACHHLEPQQCGWVQVSENNTSTVPF